MEQHSHLYNKHLNSDNHLRYKEQISKQIKSCNLILFLQITSVKTLQSNKQNKVKDYIGSTSITDITSMLK